MQKSLPDDKSKIEEVKVLAEKVLPGTADSGKVNIRSQVDSSQQEWESLLSTVK